MKGKIWIYFRLLINSNNRGKKVFVIIHGIGFFYAAFFVF